MFFFTFHCMPDLMLSSLKSEVEEGINVNTTNVFLIRRLHNLDVLLFMNYLESDMVEICFSLVSLKSGCENGEDGEIKWDPQSLQNLKKIYLSYVGFLFKYVG